MKLGIVIYSNDPETVWNAVRYANYSLERANNVRIFLMGRGVESESIETEQFQIGLQLRKFLEAGGLIQACGTCMKIRNQGGSEVCPVSNMGDMHSLVMESDKVLTF